MASEADESPRARFRFGFSGRRKRREPIEDAANASADDLLESLTRQASSQVGFGESRQRGFEVLVEDEDPVAGFEETLTSVTPLKTSTKRSLGRFAFVLMLLGGLLVVGLYSARTRLLDLSSLNSLTQTTIIRSVFTNPAEVGVVSLIALVAALLVAHRRKNSKLNLSI